ncbi:hypothetical protein bglu_1g15220 [Burkholderia glumae BGR1]|nr:hypothetical protein bglu_1g15220 [Burkholderia glumae BGR1]
MDANGWKDDALTLRLLLSAHDVESVVSMMKALQFIDSELTEYLEGMPADETSRKLRDVARDALNVERAAVSPATADRIPDECAASGGSCSYAPDGRHGEMQCRYCGKEKTATADERHEDGLLTTEALISIIERHFDHDHPDGQRLVEMAQDVAASQHKQGEPATAEDGGWAAFEPWFERAWLLNPDKDFSDRIRCKAWAWKTWKHLRGEAPATADTTGYCTRSVCGCEGSRIETKQGCYHWRIVSETATADERAALREMLDDARNEFTMVREALGVAYEPHQTLLERTLDAARASQAAAPQANAAEESEDAYVIRRLSETLADVAVTLRGDDPVHPDDPLNKIELVKRLAEVLRMEVELYRAQAAAPADAREPQWSRDIIADLQGLFDTDGITENDSGDALIRLSDAIAAVENARAGAPADAGEAVGVADSMPGTSGFTMACFEAAKVPIGTKLYAAAQGGKGGEA